MKNTKSMSTSKSTPTNPSTPPRKKDLVSGRYGLSAPAAGTAVAVKAIDMLDEA